jgi:hypothetical protein
MATKLTDLKADDLVEEKVSGIETSRSSVFVW